MGPRRARNLRQSKDTRKFSRRIAVRREIAAATNTRVQLHLKSRKARVPLPVRKVGRVTRRVSATGRKSTRLSINYFDRDLVSSCEPSTLKLFFTEKAPCTEFA